MKITKMCLPIITMLIGLLVLSFGFNIIFWSRLTTLSNIVNTITSPVDDEELQKLMEEVKRLSKQEYTTNTRDFDTKYDTKTKEPIYNNFTNPIR